MGVIPIYVDLDWCTFWVLVNKMTCTSCFWFEAWLLNTLIIDNVNASKEIMHIQNGNYEQLLSFPLVKICKLSLYKQQWAQKWYPHLWGPSPHMGFLPYWHSHKHLLCESLSPEHYYHHQSGLVESSFYVAHHARCLYLPVWCGQTQQSFLFYFLLYFRQ